MRSSLQPVTDTNKHIIDTLLWSTHQNNNRKHDKVRSDLTTIHSSRKSISKIHAMKITYAMAKEVHQNGNLF